jgi:hypothetical protein
MRVRSIQNFPMHSVEPRPVLPRLLAALSLAYLLAGLAAMLWLSPKVPYADGWRLLGEVAGQAFPANVLHADNGHREVLPNLVRLIELRVFAANQWLQIAVGAALALATALMLVRAMRMAGEDALRVRAAICAALVALFWLGSQRTLAHGNESVHAYLITLCLAVGLGLMQKRDPVALLGAVALAAVATFSFGTGIACFAALATLAWLQRRGVRTWLLLVAGAVLAAGAYLAGNAGADHLQFAPATQAPLLLRWLSAPFAYALWPAIDADVAAQVPGALGASVAVPVARTWEGVFGAFETATWPWLGIGAIGVALFVVLALRARRQPQDHGIATVGLCLSAFGLATGVVVVAARATYFTQLHPDQLLAARYVVWSSLFWGGLLLAGVGLAKQPRRAALLVAAVAVLLVPSELWMSQLALRMRAAAERGAAMAANGVVDPTVSIGETIPAELASAMPVLQRDRAAVYAWPEVAYLGRTLDPAGLAPVAASAWEIAPITGTDGDAAARVSFRAESHAQRLLIVDATRTVHGIAIPDRSRPGYWLGWTKDAALPAALQAAPLPAP